MSRLLRRKRSASATLGVPSPTWSARPPRRPRRETMERQRERRGQHGHPPCQGPRKAAGSRERFNAADEASGTARPPPGPPRPPRPESSWRRRSSSPAGSRPGPAARTESGGGSRIRRVGRVNPRFGRPAARPVRLLFTDAGWSSSVARWAHNPEVAGSNPAPATKVKPQVRGRFRRIRRRPLMFLEPQCQQDVSRRCHEVGRPDVRVSGGERCSEVLARPWVRHLVSVSVSLPNEVTAVRHASLAPSSGCRGGAAHRPL